MIQRRRLSDALYVSYNLTNACRSMVSGIPACVGASARRWLFQREDFPSGDQDEAALATRPVPAQWRYRATAPDRTPDVGTAPRSRIGKGRPKAVSLHQVSVRREAAHIRAARFELIKMLQTFLRT